jgi:hypothetical protein
MSEKDEKEEDVEAKQEGEQEGEEDEEEAVADAGPVPEMPEGEYQLHVLVETGK